MLKLVKPSKKYLPAFLRVVDDYKQDTNQFKDVQVGALLKAIEENRADEYIKSLRDAERGIGLPKGYVPGTTFWLMDDDNWVGSFTIRHRLTPHLMQEGGHIAGNISPKYRGKYSSFIGAKLILAAAHKMGLKRVLITCDANNSASYRAITGLMRLYGGEQMPDSIVKGHPEHRVWVNTTKEDKRKPWERALDKFMKRYINEPWFEGAVLCGSYASGNQNKFSDIDVTIIGSNDMGWQEKSNCYVDGFLMEYTINPIWKNQEYMQSGLDNHSFINQKMFAYGKILYDKHGVMKRLQQQSIRELKRKIKPFSKYSNEFKKYGLWCRYDDMLSLKQDGYPLDLLYWTLIDKLIDAYYDFNCLPHVSHAKIQKILTNKEFATRYHADKLPPKKFTELLMDCFNAKQKDKMTALDKLYKYVMKSGGGFDIGQFRGKHKIEKK